MPNDEFKKIAKLIDAGLSDFSELTNDVNSLSSISEIDLKKMGSYYENSWHSYGKQGWELSEQFDEEQIQSGIAYVRGLKIHKLLQESDFYWQIINKPLGYAGDAKMMEIIYRNGFDGKTKFGKLINKFTTDEKACMAVRNRKQFLIDEIEKIETGKILSIAAGPAEEILEVMRRNKHNRFDFTALDHDINTAKQVICNNVDNRLTYCIGNAFSLMKGDFRYAVPRKLFLNACEPKSDFTGFKKLISSVKYTFKQLENEVFDLVYSAGLYDYIKTFEDNHKGTKALTKYLFSLVKPGGSLIIGNFSPNNPAHIRFSMEFFQEWRLIYRDEEEMYEFASAINKSEIEDMTILMEPERINYFLKITKK